MSRFFVLFFMRLDENLSMVWTWRFRVSKSGGVFVTYGKKLVFEDGL